MPRDLQNSSTAEKSCAGERHPYDYYWRPGRRLRAAPPRLRFDPIWTPSRRDTLSPWIDFHEVPRPTPWTELFVDHLWQGDELMDAVVERFRELGSGEGRTMLDTALDHGIEAVADPPVELVNLFADLDNPPSWFDPKLWEKGRRLWNDSSLAGKVGMFIGDTFGTFVGDEVAYATGQTGRFVNDFYRRNLETIAWFRNMTVPNALSRFADPFKDTVRVRLMHAQVRAGLRRTWGDEQFAHHGNPISNAMMMNAAITFGLQPLLIDHQHGRHRSWSDLDAAVMYWGYIAHVFGVADELIPRNAAAALEAMDFIVAYAGGPSDWTDVMVGAAMGGKRGLGRLQRAALLPAAGLMAYYGGEELVRSLLRATDLADAKLRPWMRVARVLVHTNVTWRRLLDRTPGAARRAAARDSDRALWGSLLRFTRITAARNGIHGTPYDHHDRTAAVAPGCPIPRAPR
ncbi:oxygenase MpaB family protein [Mycolicibacterium mengxianglii]|uniref:oxygenase MpaB family protein n=1 Tax=Mycolicibacterium mengxianglii TaxID=2736649 RepID=UPI0018D00DC7|nr:oxygenase MpaB family protein [Mycolicibacterium mengxianglii]